MIALLSKNNKVLLHLSPERRPCPPVRFVEINPGEDAAVLDDRVDERVDSGDLILASPLCFDMKNRSRGVGCYVGSFFAVGQLFGNGLRMSILTLVARLTKFET